MLFVFAASASADEASRQEKAAKILELTNVSKSIDQVMEQVKGMTQQQLASLNLPPESAQKAHTIQDKMMQLIKENLSWEKLQPEYVKVYSELFTDEELDGMVSFYNSPAGRAVIAKQPEMMKRGMQLVQQKMVEMQPAMTKMLDEAKSKANPAGQK